MTKEEIKSRFNYDGDIDDLFINFSNEFALFTMMTPLRLNKYATDPGSAIFPPFTRNGRPAVVPLNEPVSCVKIPWEPDTSPFA